MSMTLTYIDSNNDPQGIITLNNGMFRVTGDRIQSHIYKGLQDAIADHDYAAKMLSNFEADHDDSAYIDEGYHQYLHGREVETHQAVQQLRDLLADIDGVMSETCPDSHLPASRWLEAISYTVRFGTGDRDMYVASTITRNIALLLATEGNPNCYWA